MSGLPVGLKEGRSDETETFDLINALRFIASSPPGVKYAIASEAIAAYKCVGRFNNLDLMTTARADGTTYAVGVLSAAVSARELARVVESGILRGAVSGRAANDQVWVGPDGSLVFAAPVGYVQPIAVCVNATDIFVSVEAPVI